MIIIFFLCIYLFYFMTIITDKRLIELWRMFKIIIEDSTLPSDSQIYTIFGEYINLMILKRKYHKSFSIYFVSDDWYQLFDCFEITSSERRNVT